MLLLPLMQRCYKKISPHPCQKALEESEDGQLFIMFVIYNLSHLKRSYKADRYMNSLIVAAKDLDSLLTARFDQIVG